MRKEEKKRSLLGYNQCKTLLKDHVIFGYMIQDNLIIHL